MLPSQRLYIFNGLLYLSKQAHARLLKRLPGEDGVKYPFGGNEVEQCKVHKMLMVLQRQLLVKEMLIRVW